VDIALKAISPAVNDPTTAISCVDQLSRLLIRFASREPPATVLYDPPGTVRVVIPWLAFEAIAGIGVRADPAVCASRHGGKFAAAAGADGAGEEDFEWVRGEVGRGGVEADAREVGGAGGRGDG